MTSIKLPLAALLLASTVALAQAQGVPPSSQGAASAHSDASNHMQNQPPGTVEGAGDTPIGTSNGHSAGNRGADSGMRTMHRTGMTMTHRRHRIMRRRHIMHHTAMHAMNNDNSNRGSAPNGGTNGVTPH